jgi:four helix bundle protein
MKTYRDLRVWQASMQLAKVVHITVKTFPRFETYGICAQMRSASQSVPSNIAEGHARDSTRDFIRHLAFARGSLAELQTQCLMALEFEYLSGERCDQVIALSEEISKMLCALQQSLRKRLDRESSLNPDL